MENFSSVWKCLLMRMGLTKRSCTNTFWILSLSYTHTLTHTHILSPSATFLHTHTHVRTHTQTHTLTHIHTHILSHFLSLSLYFLLFLFLSVFIFFSLPQSFIHWLSFCLSLTLFINKHSLSIHRFFSSLSLFLFLFFYLSLSFSFSTVCFRDLAKLNLLMVVRF